MKTRIIGHTDIEVSAIGLGMMGMSPMYGQINDEESIRTIHRALEVGVTLLDTADVYGNGHNEELLGKALKGCREKAVIATKFGFKPDYQGINGHPDYVKESIDKSLQRIGVDYVDLYYLHRVDPNVSVEETVGAMAELVKAGKVRAIGLSEVTPEQLRRANEVHPISALQSEYSLWSRDVEEEIIPLANELGITFVAYCPLGRGFLSGEIRRYEDLEESDFRRKIPRYQPENFDKNLQLVDRIKEMATEKNCTPSQLAIAWVMANGALPIPGTKRVAYLEQNADSVNVELTAADMDRIEEIMPNGAVFGSRSSLF